MKTLVKPWTLSSMQEEVPIINEVDVSETGDDQKSELVSSTGSKTSEMGPKLMLKVHLFSYSIHSFIFN